MSLFLNIERRFSGKLTRFHFFSLLNSVSGSLPGRASIRRQVRSVCVWKGIRIVVVGAQAAAAVGAARSHSSRLAWLSTLNFVRRPIAQQSSAAANEQWCGAQQQPFET